MQWENIVYSEFKQAAEKSQGVCVILVGCIEPHGKHLPLGTDFLTAHKIALMAAEKEPAVVFPPMYFGCIYEAKAMPGTIALKPDLLFSLYENVFSEIARNGFDKILIYNGHGGNNHFLGFLIVSRLAEKRNYTLYVKNGAGFTKEQQKDVDNDMQGRAGGHACEWETSNALYLFEDLVKMENLLDGYFPYNERRFDVGKNCGNEIDWYSCCPDYYVGDAHHSTKELGKKYVTYSVDNLIKTIKCIKTDSLRSELLQEYYDKSNM